MAKKITILVATHQIIAGVGKVLDGGEELTREKQKALGLKPDDIVELVEKGSLRQVQARLADASGGNPAIAALEARADKAEAELAEVKTQLAAALQRAEAAEAQVADLEAELAEFDEEEPGEGAGGDESGSSDEGSTDNGDAPKSAKGAAKAAA